MVLVEELTGWLLVVIVHQLFHLFLEEIHSFGLLLSYRVTCWRESVKNSVWESRQ
jgi:hypothetical protein